MFGSCLNCLQNVRFLDSAWLVTYLYLFSFTVYIYISFLLIVVIIIISSLVAIATCSCHHLRQLSYTIVDHTVKAAVAYVSIHAPHCSAGAVRCFTFFSLFFFFFLSLILLCWWAFVVALVPVFLLSLSFSWKTLAAAFLVRSPSQPSIGHNNELPSR